MTKHLVTAGIALAIFAAGTLLVNKVPAVNKALGG